jgi:predicted AAA+ superfamily ATPase
VVRRCKQVTKYELSAHKEKLVCIDEIQRKPEFFPLIRSLVDEWNRPGCFLVLGSASRDLLKQSSESLAGRDSYKRLTPFLWNEIEGRHTMEQYFSSGGFPRSILAANGATSFQWREDFISTFLERDLLQWKEFTPVAMERL